MKRFRVYYSFDIKDPATDLVVEHSKGTFEVEAKNLKSINSKELKSEIYNIAANFKSFSSYYVGYSNYYKLEEID